MGTNDTTTSDNGKGETMSGRKRERTKTTKAFRAPMHMVNDKIGCLEDAIADDPATFGDEKLWAAWREMNMAVRAFQVELSTKYIWD